MKTMVSLIVALLVAILPLGALCEAPDTPAAQATPIAEEAAAADEPKKPARRTAPKRPPKLIPTGLW